jgi:hypothetical protein
MDKPARRAVTAVKTRPEQPEAPSFLVLDPVIIADRVAGAGTLGLPPFVSDALRPAGVRARGPEAHSAEIVRPAGSGACQELPEVRR